MRASNFIMVLSLLFSITAVAGHETGHGGGAHFCSNGSTEMYDLYEFRERYGQQLRDFTGLSLDQIEAEVIKVIAAYSKNLELVVRSHRNQLNQKVRIKDVVLVKTPDANTLMTNVGCSYEQLANWDDESGFVFVSNKYWSLLDNTNKVALLMHETLYSIARTYTGATNSDAVRRLVGKLFSNGASVEDVDATSLVGRSDWLFGYMKVDSGLRKAPGHYLDVMGYYFSHAVQDWSCLLNSANKGYVVSLALENPSKQKKVAVVKYEIGNQETTLYLSKERPKVEFNIPRDGLRHIYVGEQMSGLEFSYADLDCGEVSPKYSLKCERMDYGYRDRGCLMLIRTMSEEKRNNDSFFKRGF